jgi:hypothetical protein
VLCEAGVLVGIDPSFENVWRRRKIANFIRGEFSADAAIDNHIKRLVNTAYKDTGIQGYIRDISLEIAGTEQAMSIGLLARASCYIQSVPSLRKNTQVLRQALESFGLKEYAEKPRDACEVATGIDSSLLRASELLGKLRVNNLLEKDRQDLEILQGKIAEQIAKRATEAQTVSSLSGVTIVHRPLNAQMMAERLEAKKEPSKRQEILAPTPAAGLSELPKSLNPTKEELAKLAATAALEAAQAEAEHDDPLKTRLEALAGMHEELLKPFTFSQKQLRGLGLTGGNSLEYTLLKGAQDVQPKLRELAEVPSGEVFATMAGLFLLASDSKMNVEDLQSTIAQILTTDSEYRNMYTSIFAGLFRPNGIAQNSSPRNIGREIDWVADRIDLFAAIIDGPKDTKGTSLPRSAPLKLNAELFTLENLQRVRRALFPEDVVQISVGVDNVNPPQEITEDEVVPLHLETGGSVKDDEEMTVLRTAELESSLHGFVLPELLQGRGIEEFDIVIFPSEASVVDMEKFIKRHYPGSVEKSSGERPLDWDMIENLLFLRDTYGGRVGLTKPGNLGTTQDDVPYFLAILPIKGEEIAVAEHPVYGNATYLIRDSGNQKEYKILDIIAESRAFARVLGAKQMIHPDLDVDNRALTHLNKILHYLGLQEL